MTEAVAEHPLTGEGVPADWAGALAFLDPAEARRLAAHCTEAHFAAGDILMTAGRPADFLGLVLAGKVAVKKEAAFPGRYTLLAEIEVGGMVGEGAMVTGEEHGTTVVAATDIRLLTLSRAEFQRLCDEDRPLALKLAVRIIQVLRRRLASAGERLSWIL